MRTKNRVTGIIIRENKILMIHRFKHGEEYWVFPGGGVEEGETLEEGLHREIWEETSLNILSFTKIYEEIGAFGDNIIFYFCNVSLGEPQLGGPEKVAHCPDNQFILEWIDFERIFTIEDIYPKPNKKLRELNPSCSKLVLSLPKERG